MYLEESVRFVGDPFVGDPLPAAAAAGIVFQAPKHFPLSQLVLNKQKRLGAWVRNCGKVHLHIRDI